MPERDEVQRAILPIPNRQHVALTTLITPEERVRIAMARQ